MPGAGAILYTEHRAGLTDMMTFVQRPEGREPGERESKVKASAPCKGPEMRACPACLKNSRGVSRAGTE